VRIVYYSMTGNTKSFAERFASEGYEVASITESPSSEDFVLITPTYDFGEVPKVVQRFLEQYGERLKAVVATGNRNWGGFFGKSGDIISTNYSVPLLHKVELRGTDEDFRIIKERLENDDRLRR
jgi:protein involved in ribonucleotide reduction